MESPLGVDPASIADARESIAEMERTLRAGGFDKAIVINALSEVDCYYLAVTTPDGNQSVMIVARSRVAPGIVLFVGKPIPLGEETARMVAMRLPPPPKPTVKGAVAAPVVEATPGTKRQILEQRKQAQLEELRKRHGENSAVPVVPPRARNLGREIPQG